MSNSVEKSPEWPVHVAGEELMLALGAYIAAYLEPGDVIYLSGPLGAGKTTLARGIARGLGYSGRVTSPTFTLMNIYENQPLIYHMDFYRLEEWELADAGMEEALDGDGICLVEWPKFSPELMPDRGFYVSISLVDEDYERERRLLIGARGDSCRERLKEMMRHADIGH